MINLYHLYPDQLNLYGDRGNLLALLRRAEWRGIELRVIPVQPGGDINFLECDLLFMGGGQDSDQALVASDLKRRRNSLVSAVESGMPIFAVCGSYQLLGNYYSTTGGDTIEGLEIVDFYTKADHKRLIGNAVISCNLWDPPKTLVGFENHAGKTFLGPGVQPLGRVLAGSGNNGSDSSEGVVYKNIIGTYLHGALLPKNPWLTDYLLYKALSYRKRGFDLPPLDDTLEIKAHQVAIALSTSKKHKRLSSRA